MSTDFDVIFAKSQEVIKLINEVENASIENVSEKLRACVRTLIQFCKFSLRLKKALRDDGKKKTILKSISLIKTVTPLFSQHARRTIADKRNWKASIALDQSVTTIIQAVRSVIKVLKSSKDMDPISILMDTSDTLYFDFTLMKLADEDTSFEKKQPTAQSTLMLPQPGLHQRGTVALPQPNREVAALPAKHVLPIKSLEEQSLDMAEESSDLLSSAYDFIRRSQKVSLSCSPKDKETLKNLRSKLNEAIINFDASTTNLLEDMTSIFLKERLTTDGKVLLMEMKQMKDFLQMYASNKIAVQQIKDPAAFKRDAKTKIGSVDNNNNSNNSLNPLNIQSFHAKSNVALAAVSYKNMSELEKEINALSECQEGVKTILLDIKKRSRITHDTENMLQKSSNTTHQFIRHMHDAILKSQPTDEEIARLHILAKDWTECLAVLSETIWNHLAPWTQFTGELFLKRDNVETGKLTNSMNKFKHINKQLRELYKHFVEVNDDVIADEQRKTHLVKAKNLSVELNEHSKKVLQLSKLHLLDDINLEEWPVFGLCLYKWANAAQQLLSHVDSLSLMGDETMTIDVFMEKHEHLKLLADQCIQSCQDFDLKSQLSSAMAMLVDAYQSVRSVSRGKDNSLLPLLYTQWRLKAYALSQKIEKTTLYLSKPIDTLVASTAKCDAESPSFEEYENIFVKKMERIRTHTCLGVDKSTVRADVHKAIETLDELDSVCENLLRNCRMLQGNTTIPRVRSLLHFQRLQWLSFSNYLLYLLRQLPEVRYSAISAMMRHFLSEHDVSNPNEFLEVMSEHIPDSMHMQIIELPVARSLSDSNTSEYDSMYSTCADYTESSENTLDAILHQQDNIENSQAEKLYFSNQLASSNTDAQLLPPQQNSVVKRKTTKSSPKPTVSPKPKNWKRDKEIFDGDIELSPRLQHDFTERTPKSIAAAAHILHREADKWEDENNSIIKVVKLMANQMFQMAEFSKGRGHLKSKEDMVHTAKAIAANAKTVAQFATTIADHCTDQSCRKDLLHYIELVPTISTQLRIVASVKSVTTDDETADVMLVTNAENLMKGVVGTLKAAEAACVLISNESGPVHDDSHHLAFQWKRKIRMKRAMDALASPRDELGLRISKERTLPSLTDLLVE